MPVACPLYGSSTVSSGQPRVGPLTRELQVFLAEPSSEAADQQFLNRVSPQYEAAQQRSTATVAAESRRTGG
jgi:hypothetical protein